MPMNTLHLSGFDRYYADEGTRADRTACFIHVPKTAGSSLTAELAAVMQPYNNLFITAPDPAKSFDQNYIDLLRKFWTGPGAARARLVSGHFTYNQMLQAKVPIEKLRLITFLRHPVDRCISDYRYSSSAAHPQHGAFRSLYPTVDAYLRNAGEMNKLWTYFRSGPGEDAKMTAARMAEEFCFVGLTEFYDLGTTILFRLLGVDRSPTLRRNVTMNAEVPVESLNEKRKQIAEANHQDMAIYEHFRRIYEDVAPNGPGASATPRPASSQPA